MGHYAIALDLTGKVCLVVGGGQVAERKIRSLLECGACVRVVSPELTAGLGKVVESGMIDYRQGRYRISDLSGVFLVIGATNCKKINQQVSEDCLARNLLVNIVDDPAHCNFYVPAVIKRGLLTIAVTTGGRSPLLARRIRDELELAYGPQYGEFLDLISIARKDIISKVTNSKEKRKMLENLVCDEVMDLLKKDRLDLLKGRMFGVNHGSGTQPQDGSS
ncbi:MAG: bifunctional precorrin-2 dehydrogenase/sirohydrochlorin ferrochelatase [Desulfotomaculaceae bacterium]|nr:bifunctional precorrin-2 dehydrogenase/sirohydrochlorin ferrochelatase [Desulfotomaculaceae bacterium]